MKEHSASANMANWKPSERRSRKLQPIVRQRLSDRIKHRLSLCNKCGGSGSFERSGHNEPLACMSCCDWLSALKQVELLEEIALIALDAEPWLKPETKEKTKWCREQTGLMPNRVITPHNN